jgi:hypothetical protein
VLVLFVRFAHQYSEQIVAGIKLWTRDYKYFIFLIDQNEQLYIHLHMLQFD